MIAGHMIGGAPIAGPPYTVEVEALDDKVYTHDRFRQHDTPLYKRRRIQEEEEIMMLIMSFLESECR